jgi:hypothetical protein
MLWHFSRAFFARFFFRAIRRTPHPCLTRPRMYYTPEFQANVVLACSPITSAVAVWGMRSPASASHGHASPSGEEGEGGKSGGVGGEKSGGVRGGKGVGQEVSLVPMTRKK